MGLSETLKAISAPIRRQILDSLKSGPKFAGEIVEQFQLTGANSFSSFIYFEKSWINFGGKAEKFYLLSSKLYGL